MNAFYVRCMRAAAAILFVFAFAVLLGSVLTAVLAFRVVQADPAYQTTLQGLQWIQLMQVLLSGLQNAAMPLFGAALLWRADRWLAQRGEAGE